MVSHKPTGSSVSIRASRTGRGSEIGEMESIYHSSPIPSIPRLLSTQRPVGDSMLAYTERMREISKYRNESALLGSDDPPASSLLEVQARRIPKTGMGPPRKGGGKVPPQRKPRRPLSLDELIGRPGKKGESSTSTGRSRERRYSEPGLVPPMALGSPSSKEKKEEAKRIRISFVSAADLFDLVDFSLRSKKSRNDSLKLARAEDTFRLIKEANLFRSTHARNKMKMSTEREENLDTASLIVHGTSSPRESPRDGDRGGWVEKDDNGGWAKREIQRNADRYDSDDEEEDGQDQDVDLDFDLLREKRMLLLQPHKLRFRPKRAKRMRLHRSQLSAIPEDERHKQEGQSKHAQEPSSTCLPVLPTTSSLAAIKGSRKQGTTKVPHIERRKLPHDDEVGGDSLVTEDTHPGDSQPDTDSDRTSTDKPRTKHAVALHDNDPRLQSSEVAQKKRQTPRSEEGFSVSKKNDSPRRAVAGSKTSSLNGQSAAHEAANARVKAQKKFKKLIFLRDQPDQIHHRYS